MKKYYFFLLVLFFLVNKSNASHLAGGSITFECTGPNMYDIFLTLYGDCGGFIELDSVQQIIHYNSVECGITFTDTVLLSGIKNVSQFCALDSLDSQCYGNALPGIEEYTYSNTVTLPTQCSDWQIYFEQTFRNTQAITNIELTYTPNATFYIASFLSNIDSICNNSPQFVAENPILYVCQNQPSSYNFGAIDFDGDSLSFSLVPAKYDDVGLYNVFGGQMDSLTLPAYYSVQYNYPWSGAEPITGMTIDKNTGKINFTPQIQGNFVVVVEVEEFDTAGVRKSMVLREMQIVVLPCVDNNQPNINAGAITNLSPTANLLDSFSIEVSEGDTLVFNATFDDLDLLDTLTLINNITSIFPNAVVSWTGTNPITAEIRLKIPLGTTGKSYLFSLTVDDNHCPYYAQQTYFYNIVVIRTTVSQDVTICLGNSTQLDAQGGGSYIWSSISGDPIIVGTNFSCDTCISPIATPSVTTTYTVTSNLLNNNTDTVTVFVNSNLLDATIYEAGPFCYSDVATNLVAVDTGGVWSGNGITDVNNGIFDPSVSGVGTHEIIYAISLLCGDTDTVNIVVNRILNATISAVAPLCPTDTASNLLSVDTGGAWSGIGITDTSNGIFEPIVAGAGTHVITYTINQVCKDTDTVNIVVNQIPDATILPVAPLCPTDTASSIFSVDTGGIWSGNGIVDDANGIFDPAMVGIGTYLITYMINGVCSDTDTVTVTVLSPPTVNISTTDESCQGCDGTATANVTGTRAPYTYLWDDQPAGGQTDSVATALCMGSYAVTVIDSSGCVGNNSDNVLLASSPNAYFTISPQPTSTSITIIHFTDSSLGNIHQWNWTFYDTLNINILGTDTVQNPSFRFPNEAGIYPVKLSISDISNCEVDTTLFVIINEDYVIYVPNAFTPNGDAINDEFYPQGTGINPDNYHIYIFNRWGELIFESDDQNNYWDGTVSGSNELVQDGTYVWMIVLEDETPEKKLHKIIGRVTVIK